MASEADNPLKGIFTEEISGTNRMSDLDAAELMDNTPETTGAFVNKLWLLAAAMVDQAKASLADTSPEDRRYRLHKVAHDLTEQVRVLADLNFQIELTTTTNGRYYYTTSKVDGKPIPLGHQDGAKSVSGGLSDIDFVEAIETRKGVVLENPQDRERRYTDIPSLVLEDGLYRYVVPIADIATIMPTQISGKSIDALKAA